MAKYIYDIVLREAICVEADSEEAAIAILDARLDFTDANLGCFENGEPIMIGANIDRNTWQMQTTNRKWRSAALSIYRKVDLLGGNDQRVSDAPPN